MGFTFYTISTNAIIKKALLLLPAITHAESLLTKVQVGQNVRTLFRTISFGHFIKTEFVYTSSLHCIYISYAKYSVILIHVNKQDPQHKPQCAVIIFLIQVWPNKAIITSTYCTLVCATQKNTELCKLDCVHMMFGPSVAVICWETWKKHPNGNRSGAVAEP